MKNTYNELIEKLEDEKDELFIKVCKLEKFINSDSYDLLPEYHQFLLNQQLTGMNLYLSALTFRIKHLKGSDK